MSLLLILAGAVVLYVALTSFDEGSEAKETVSEVSVTAETPTTTITNTETPVFTATPERHYLFQTITGEIDFEISELVEVDFEFLPESEDGEVMPIRYSSEMGSIEEALGGCDEEVGRMLLFGTYPRGSENPSYEDSLAYVHAGRCRSTGDQAFETVRRWLEGGYSMPSSEQREKRLAEIVGQTIEFGEATFIVMDATYLNREELDIIYEADRDKYESARYGWVDRFFENQLDSDLEPKRELFIVFCGSEGGIDRQDWMAAKYFLRLWPVVDDVVLTP